MVVRPAAQMRRRCQAQRTRYASANRRQTAATSGGQQRAREGKYNAHVCNEKGRSAVEGGNDESKEFKSTNVDSIERGAEPTAVKYARPACDLMLI